MKNLLLLLVLIILAGCSSSDVEQADADYSLKGAKQVDVYKMASFSDIVEDSLMTFDSPDVVKDFVDAFSSAVKQPGVVDISEPHYFVEIGKESFYLWIHEDRGTIMNMEDTNTIYSLRKKGAERIYEVLHLPVLLFLEKQGLFLEEVKLDKRGIFGMKLNGEWPDAYKLDQEDIFIYTFDTNEEREDGMLDWQEKTAMYNLISHKIYGAGRVLLFYIYPGGINSIDPEIDTKIRNGLGVRK